MNLPFLISIFPVVFMIHDFEEIIFYKTWLTKNQDLLKIKFPRISQRVLPHLKQISTEAFSVAVAEEFILLSIITYTSILWKIYYLWFAIFMAFSIHFVVHIIQWIVFRKYIPAIVTSVISLPYSIYTIHIFSLAGILNSFQAAMWTVIGLVIMILNLFFAHKLARYFENWKLN